MNVMGLVQRWKQGVFYCSHWCNIYCGAFLHLILKAITSATNWRSFGKFSRHNWHNSWFFDSSQCEAFFLFVGRPSMGTLLQYMCAPHQSFPVAVAFLLFVVMSFHLKLWLSTQVHPSALRPPYMCCWKLLVVQILLMIPDMRLQTTKLVLHACTLLGVWHSNIVLR